MRRSLVEIARREGLPQRYVTRLARLAFVSPVRRRSSRRGACTGWDKPANVSGWPPRATAGLEGSATDALALRASCEPRVGLFNTLLRFFSVAKVSEGARVASPLREIR
jgi:hypothetical protein